MEALIELAKAPFIQFIFGALVVAVYLSFRSDAN